ncbi:MAG: Coenzyme F420 hydrogenase/dehydrogenase, beta subunit C-terminal domain [Candidatus Nezhaarchaeales archaeon]
MAIYKPRAFGNLIGEVIAKKICCKCGLCVSSCPVNSIIMTEDGPKLISPCKQCEACYYSCPRSQAFSKELLEASIDGGNRDDLLGKYVKIISARTTLEEVRARGQDGGVATTLLMYAIKNKIIDGAVVTSKGHQDPWKPVPKLALTIEDVLSAAGAKYSNCPNLIALGDAVFCYYLNKVCVVGVPCQVAAARNVKVQPRAATKVGDKIAFIIGLFCVETFNHKRFLEYLTARNIDVQKVSKFDIKESKFKAYVGNDEVLCIPVKELKDCVNEFCYMCRDLTALYADISIGAVGSQRGWSTVIIRTSQGAELFEGAVKEGYLEVKDIGGGITVLKRLAEKKASGKWLLQV